MKRRGRWKRRNKEILNIRLFLKAEIKSILQTWIILSLLKLSLSLLLFFLLLSCILVFSRSDVSVELLLTIIMLKFWTGLIVFNYCIPSGIIVALPFLSQQVDFFSPSNIIIRLFLKIIWIFERVNSLFFI